MLLLTLLCGKQDSSDNVKMVWILFSALLFSLAFFSRAIDAAPNCSYLVTAPEMFRPGMDVEVNVYIFKEDVPGTAVTVRATFYLGKVPIVSTTGSFNKGVHGILSLHIPLTNVHYEAASRMQKRLEISGSGGLTFNTTEYIMFENKAFSIYIQTDKGIYKPGQTVHMRILGVYPSLHVIHDKMAIKISDPKDNILAYWKDETSRTGVVTKDFELTSQPNMGDWKISVEMQGNKKEVKFEVKEYVLPKFEVKIVPDKPYATLSDPDLRVSIRAKYTYGKSVKGTANVRVFFPCYRYYAKRLGPVDHCKSYTKELQIDGVASLVVDKKTLVGLYSGDSPYNDYTRVYVNVSVTDELTKKTQSADEINVILHKSSIVLTYSESNPETFKPGFPFEALIEVTRPDKTPVTSGNVEVTTETGKVKVERTYPVDKDGYVIVKVEDTTGHSSISLKAEITDEFGEKSYGINRYVEKFHSASNTYLRITVENYEVKVGDTIVCQAVATEQFDNISYLLMSRGKVIHGNTVPVSAPQDRYRLPILATSAMAPSLKLVVYFVRVDGEVVADSVTIKVNGAFENKVSAAFDVQEQRPGKNVNVNVKASAYSSVNLLAVDKSVLLLNKGNDFSVGQVMQDLDAYGGDSGSYPPWFRWRRRRRSIMPWYPSATSSKAVFEQAGVVMFTNCTLNTLYGYRRFDMMESSAFDDSMVTKSDGGNKVLAEVEKVRSFFPETWLWQTVDTDSNGKATVSTTAPDTITSWVLSAFAVNNNTGFGVGEEKPQLKVFQPFFASMDLPYSVIRGEHVALKVIVYNYEDNDMEVTVTLEASDAWTNINEIENTVVTSADVATVIKVPANGGKTVSFPIIPTKLGSVPVTVRAQSSTSADAVMRNLLVEPEGIEQDYSYSLLLDFSTLDPDFTKELELALPFNVVKDSARATVSVIGDIMGSSINGIEKLMKMPYGCGEQNMINFAPSMFIRAYLEAVGQLTQNIKEKSIRFMTAGYQRELQYQHKDGSFSAFGERYGNTRPGSLWLTSFVLKSFAKAAKYIYIDPGNMKRILDFIVKTQRSDGSFKEPGTVSSYLQGGLKSTNREALTAYVLVSLLESGSSRSDVKSKISNAVSYLNGKLSEISDTYTLALVTRALDLANDPAKDTALNELLKLAVKEDGTMHWTEKQSSEQTGDESWLRPYYHVRSADVEITAYALLVYANRRDKQNSLPIVRWLAQQRNSFGGYSSTQDTVIGIQAMAKIAPLFFTSDTDFTVDIGLSSDPAFKKSFKVDKNNIIVLQEKELPSTSGNVIVSGTGKGIGVVQVGVTYNVHKTAADNSFMLNVEVMHSDMNKVETKSCVKYTGEEDNSGMAILEVGLPSGFNVDQDDVNELVNDESNEIQRIELEGRKTVLYFNQVPSIEEICVNLVSQRSHAVGKAQPIPIVVYDYYKPEKRATTMYATQEDVDVCAVCSDCLKCKDRPTGVAHRPSIFFAQFFAISLAILLYYTY